MTSWLKRNFITLFAYASLFVSLGFYLNVKLDYWNVESWPSVEAKLNRAGEIITTAPERNHYVFHNLTLDPQFLYYTYSVEGQEYMSDTVSPNTKVMPMNPFNRPLRAYYNPKDPRIAVLIPTPYEETTVLVIAAFSALFVTLHFWFTFPEWWAQRKRRRAKLTIDDSGS